MDVQDDPPNLFYGTGIPACIIVIDRRGSASWRGIIMLDASSGFIKDGPKNRLRSQDIHKWMTTIAAKIQGEMDRISGSLATRLIELADRYDAPVTTLAGRVGDLEAKVNEHLRKMGFDAELDLPTGIRSDEN